MTGLRVKLFCGVALYALFSAGMAVAGGFTIGSGETEVTTQILDTDGDSGTVEAEGSIDVPGAGAVGIGVTANETTVDNGGSVTAQGGDGKGIEVTGHRNRVTNSGLVEGGKAAVYATGDDNVIVNDGRVEGVSGLDVAGETNSITNNGVVSALWGVVVTGDGNAILNTGELLGQQTGVEVYGIGNSITNTGYASGDYASLFVVGDDNTLSNSGQVSSAARGMNAWGNRNSVTNTATVYARWGLIIDGEGNTVTNSGEVVTLDTGVEIYGSRNTAINSGTLASDWIGIYNSEGTGNTIRNSGTVNAEEAGIFSGSYPAVGVEDPANPVGNGNLIVNSGTVFGVMWGIYSRLETGTVIDNSGMVEAGAVGVHVEQGSGNRISNSASVYAGHTGVFLEGSTGTLLDNTGTVTGGTSALFGYAGSGNAITNSGVMRGVEAGVFLDEESGFTISNTGTIAGEGWAGIYAGLGTNNTISTAGTVEGNAYGIYIDQEAGTAVTNAGTVLSRWIGISGTLGTGNAIVNSGRVAGDFDGINLYEETGLTLTNSGMVEGGAYGIFNDVGTGNSFVNSGTVTGGTGGIFSAYGGTNNAITNSGTVAGGLVGIHLIDETGTTITNTGMVTGGTGGGVTRQNVSGSGGIVIEGGSGNTVINAGTIAGAPYAVVLGGSSNTLVLRPGSNIQGMIDFGTGNSLGLRRGLNTALSYQGDPLIEAPDAPYVVAGGVLAAVDPLGFEAQNEMLGDLTRVIADGIGNRLAATRRAGGSAAVALSGQGVVPTAHVPAGEPFAASPWLSGLGTWRHQRDDDLSDEFDSRIAGVMGGVDGRVSDGLRLGGFAGWAAGRFDPEANTGDIDSEAYFGGVYAGLREGAHFLDLALTGGVSHQEGERTVMNNTVAGGVEQAKADYDGMFVSPSATLGTEIGLGGAALTPSLRGRYAAMFQPDYEEKGSAANLSVEERTVQLFDLRVQLALEAPVPLESGTLDVAARLGADAGFASSDDVEAELLGESLGFAAGDGDDTLRGFVGLDIAYVTDGGMRLFAGGEFGLETDETTTATASAGFTFSF